ncbi:metal ABC transporter substrate-binding protein [Acinetobacter haemolyticus]|uniref:metal ABC transporter substrate-binding protein n=1 Tax=Acinetobacter haemolyticus TaxID=29430 RepID=UPI001331F451|nr:metal ABC transporter substrate-binding protein [Acinetobacter haemolyticus]NAR69321.1 zinc ABC transporter solute-binding protein [Acinetobacter haemolyticus]QHI24366.1 zinc ABC transporter substrate-binding protein [Acinetobacter haemolyticus]
MLRLVLFVTFSLLSTWGWTQSLVVSTQPIYLIAKEVTNGVETPTLLLSDQTGHDVHLTPAHRKIIQDASLVIWLGKAHEAPLDKLLSQNRKAISLLDAGILTILPQRSLRGASLDNTVDSHVWLEPNNAVRIAFFIAALRSQQYPENKAKYTANAREFAQQMRQTAQQYESSHKSKPYWSYHDAYQYLERALNLKFAGALTDDPYIAPTAAQIKYLNDNRPKTQMCLLAEISANQNVYRRLNPVIFETVDESMNGEDNFIAAWKKLASKTDKCVISVQN